MITNTNIAGRGSNDNNPPRKVSPEETGTNIHLEEHNETDENVPSLGVNHVNESPPRKSAAERRYPLEDTTNEESAPTSTILKRFKKKGQPKENHESMSPRGVDDKEAKLPAVENALPPLPSTDFSLEHDTIANTNIAGHELNANNPPRKVSPEETWRNIHLEEHHEDDQNVPSLGVNHVSESPPRKAARQHSSKDTTVNEDSAPPSSATRRKRFTKKSPKLHQKKRGKQQQPPEDTTVDIEQHAASQEIPGWADIAKQNESKIDSLTKAITIVLNNHPSGSIWKTANFKKAKFKDGPNSKYVFRKLVWNLLTLRLKKTFFPDGKLQDSASVASTSCSAVKKWRTNVNSSIAKCPTRSLEKSRQHYANMDPEEKAQILQRRRQRYANMDPEEKAQKLQYLHQRYANMDPEEKAQKLQYLRQRYANMDPEEKAQIYERHRKEYLERCAQFKISDMDGKEVQEVVEDLYKKKGSDHLDGIHSLEELLEEGCALYFGVCGRPTWADIHTEGYRFIIDLNEKNISVIMRDPSYKDDRNKADKQNLPRKVDYYGHRTMGLVKLKKQECIERGIKTYILMNNNWRSKENPLKIEMQLQRKIDNKEFGTQKLHRTCGAGVSHSSLRDQPGTMAIFVTVLPKDFFIHNPDIVVVDERKESNWRSKAAYETDVYEDSTQWEQQVGEIMSEEVMSEEYELELLELEENYLTEEEYDSGANNKR